jgi:hypothetical protein
MIVDKVGMRGKVTATVYKADGSIKTWDMISRVAQLKANIKNMMGYRDLYYVKRVIILVLMFPVNFVLDKLVSRVMISINHNIVTDQGDALIADLMSETPARDKVNNANGHIEVGTAYSAVGAKSQTGCHTPTGTRKDLSATYPKQKGAFGAASDNVTQYRCLFAAGDLTATVNEASMHNAAAAGDCLAYAAVTPDAVVAATDTLQIDWELTFTGA